MRYWLSIVIVTMMTLRIVAQADHTQQLVFAGVEENTLSVYVFDLAEGEIVEQYPADTADTFHDISWGPGGAVLGYTHTQISDLGIAPRHTNITIAPLPTLPDRVRPYVLATSLSTGLQKDYNTTFDDRGNLIYAVRPVQDRIFEHEILYGVVVDIYTASFMGGRAQKIGEVVRQYGCGHTPSTPMEALHDIETRYAASFISDTDHGLVFSYGCFGDGLALAERPSGDMRVLSENLSHMVISNDKTRVAGLVRQAGASHLEVISLETGTTLVYSVDLAAGASITQLVWSPDDASIYYAVQEPVGSLEMDEAVSARLEAINISESLLRAYRVEIYELDRATGNHNIVYEHPDAFAIGRLIPTEAGLVFSQIANGTSMWIEHMLDTGAAYQFDDDINTLADIALYYLPYGAAQPTVIGTGITQAAVSPPLDLPSLD